LNNLNCEAFSRHFSINLKLEEKRLLTLQKEKNKTTLFGITKANHSLVVETALPVHRGK